MSEEQKINLEQEYAISIGETRIQVTKEQLLKLREQINNIFGKDNIPYYPNIPYYLTSTDYTIRNCQERYSIM